MKKQNMINFLKTNMVNFINFLKTKKYIFTIIFAVIGVFALGIYIGFSNRLSVGNITIESGSQFNASIIGKDLVNPILAHKKPKTILDKVVDTFTFTKNKNTQIDFSPFWKVWNEIDNKHPGEKLTDQQKLNGAIAGLVGSLNDPYSVFFDPEQTKDFQAEISGSFVGVGMEVGIKDKILTVISPLKDTPAFKADIRPGDRILKIDSTVTNNLSVDKAVKLIRGEKGTTVILTIFRAGENESREISIVRDIINVPLLDTELRSDGIFVIKLYSFSANSSSLFAKAMTEFGNSKTDKLLLDLRNNPGGYLDAAVDISSYFLPVRKTIVIEDYGVKNKGKEKIFHSFGYKINGISNGISDIGTDSNKKLKFVILINNGSASASEIVAGAMQDHKVAKLVGQKSYGKGSVQEVVGITPETVLKITIANWLTPNRNLITDKGLTPDYLVEFTPKDYEEKKDPQLDKGIELLNNWSN